MKRLINSGEHKLVNDKISNEYHNQSRRTFEREQILWFNLFDNILDFYTRYNVMLYLYIRPFWQFNFLVTELVAIIRYVFNM